jgi:hypothetical protein
MFRFLIALATAVPILLTSGHEDVARAEPAESPVVVELYTSQGCSSCPPADDFLGELAARDGVLALSFHVDYWNYIGWEDPFSMPEATERQRAYRHALGLRVAYTPQMVIDGRSDAVGSNRGAVEAAIAAAAANQHVAVAFSGDAQSGYRVRLPETALDAPATVWVVLYDRSHETAVKRGENTGRTIRNSNVVRGLVELARWDGAATEIPLDVAPELTAGRDACAVIVQQDDSGPVLGAATMLLTP